MDGCVADARDGGEHACPIDLLLCLLTMCRAFGYELWEIDLPCSDVTLYSWNNCEGGKKKKKKKKKMKKKTVSTALLLELK